MLFFRADTTVFSRKTLIFLSWTAAGCSTGISLEKAFVFADYPDHDCVRTGRFDGEKAVLSALHTCAAWYRCIVLCCGFAGETADKQPGLADCSQWQCSLFAGHNGVCVIQTRRNACALSQAISKPETMLCRLHGVVRIFKIGEMNMEYRIEHDSMGEVKVPADKYWAAQTERSHENFLIGVGIETMPREITHAFGILKKAAAMANHKLRPERMTEEKLSAISTACDEVISGSLNEHFPLVVWQTGSGTQSNMNANEVIANRGNEVAGKKILHPNDDVNMSQSSNDTFPTAMHISAVLAVEDKVLPAIDELVATFRRLEEEHEGIVKSGRTHLQDATPIKFSQEISGWRTSLERDREMLVSALPYLKTLALGGTAVGTGLNAPEGFDVEVAKAVSKLTGKEFVTASNKFHALTSKDEIVFAHGALKALAADMMKIANDVRWLASGPRDGLGEITIPGERTGFVHHAGQGQSDTVRTGNHGGCSGNGQRRGSWYGSFSGQL